MACEQHPLRDRRAGGMMDWQRQALAQALMAPAAAPVAPQEGGVLMSERPPVRMPLFDADLRDQLARLGQGVAPPGAGLDHKNLVNFLMQEPVDRSGVTRRANAEEAGAQDSDDFENTQNSRFNARIGGAIQRAQGRRVLGYGGFIEGRAPVGTDGAALDASLAASGMRMNGGQGTVSRLQGLGLGYTAPGGDRFSVDWHNRQPTPPDTLPGANPDEVSANKHGSSRGLRFGWQRPF